MGTQVRGVRTGGALVTALFALPWALTGASAVDEAAGPLRTAAVAATAAAVAAAVVLGRRGDRTRVLPDDWNRDFHRVGIVQTVLIAAVVAALVNSGRLAWVPAAVCLVVGLHFLPLAQVFAQRQYAWTGVALCAVAVAGTALLQAGEPSQSQLAVGCGAAIVLWGTSLHISRRG